MSRISFSGARTGQRARTGGGGMIDAFEWEMGDRKRLVFPIVNDSLVMLAKPFHPVTNRGAVVLPKSNGQGTYAVDKVRCTHVHSQTNYDEGYKLAQKGEPCVFCQVALYEERRKWAKIREQYSKEEFQALTKEEKKAVFKELEADETVSASYYSETLADGTSRYSTHYDIYILAIDLSLDQQGNVITDVVNGVSVPKHRVVLMPASKARLEKFKSAVDQALMSGMLSREALHPYIENEGTDMEEEVLIGWVDFLVTFPMKQHKMESGKDMGVMPMAQGASVVSQHFIDTFNGKADVYEREAETTFDRLYVNLQAHSPEQARSMFVAGAGYVDELAEQYRVVESYVNDNNVTIPSDTEREQQAFASVIANYEKYNATSEDATETAPSTEQPIAQTAPPVEQTIVQTAPPVTPPVEQPIAQTAPPVEQTVAPTPPQAETAPPPPQLDDAVFDV